MLHFRIIHLTSAELSKNSIVELAVCILCTAKHKGNHQVKFNIFKTIINNKAIKTQEATKAFSLMVIFNSIQYLLLFEVVNRVITDSFCGVSDIL